MAVKPRDLALAVLNALDESPGFAERYLELAFQRSPDLSERDRAFTTHLVQGVLRWRLRLDWAIEQAVRFPFKRIELPVLNILRIAIYQIHFLNRVPVSAAVNEAVSQAKSQSRGHVAGFVNGILRNICRQKDQIPFPDRQKAPIRFLSIFYSYPVWLVEKWIREFGIDFAEALLKAGNEFPGLVIRANRLKSDRHVLIERLKKEGVTGSPCRYAPEGVTLEGLKGPVDHSEAFREGLFSVQGEAAQVCTHLLGPESGETVLDFCAGLGGKSTHIAELMDGTGTIIALDLSYDRLAGLSRGARRLGIQCIRPVVGDAARKPSCLLSDQFEKILVDSPCSGLGVISKHPDGKWVRDEKDIKRLALLQRDILKEAVPLLRKGGRMLYVTCTLSREENEDVVRGLLQDKSDMRLVNLRDHVPVWGLDLIDEHGFFRTYPSVHEMEGFFGALFTKKEG
jgi:16S rRNA (cytosine967-C5)-methyltransferase